MPSQPPRQPHSTRAERAPNAPASPSSTEAPTPTRLTMALAWVFVLGMLVIVLAAIFLVTHAL